MAWTLPWPTRLDGEGIERVLIRQPTGSRLALSPTPASLKKMEPHGPAPLNTQDDGAEVGGQEKSQY